MNLSQLLEKLRWFTNEATMNPGDFTTPGFAGGCQWGFGEARNMVGRMLAAYQQSEERLMLDENDIPARLKANGFISDTVFAALENLPFDQWPSHLKKEALQNLGLEKRVVYTQIKELEERT